MTNLVSSDICSSQKPAHSSYLWRYDARLREGILLRREKRFLAHVELEPTFDAFDPHRHNHPHDHQHKVERKSTRSLRSESAQNVMSKMSVERAGVDQIDDQRTGADGAHGAHVADGANGIDRLPVVAHCANPGSMMGLADPGARVRLLPLPLHAGRSLAWRWVQTYDQRTGVWVGVDTLLPNRITPHLVGASDMNGIVFREGCVVLQKEIGLAPLVRLDLLVRCETTSELTSETTSELCAVEVKSVTLSRNVRHVEFPDAATARGVRHLEALVDVQQGLGVVGQNARRRGVTQAELWFVVQRGDADVMLCASDIDPAYAIALDRAQQNGVTVRAVGLGLDSEGAWLQRADVPLRLNGRPLTS